MSETEPSQKLSAWGKRMWALRLKAHQAINARRHMGDHSDEIEDKSKEIVDALGSIVLRSAEMAAKLRECHVTKNQAYLERNTLVALLARLYPSGLRATEIDGWEASWNGCVYIDLPTGQVSFHYHDNDAHLFEGLPPYTKPYDGHDKAMAMKRLRDAFGYDFQSTATLIGN